MYDPKPDTDDERSHSALDRLELGSTWEVIGPFPSGMREHPLSGSPLDAFPYDPSLDPDVDSARRPYNPTETFPSYLGFGGTVSWSKFTSNASEDGWVEISYPQIRWDQLSGDQGWNALQYQVLMRTDLAVPAIRADQATPILAELIQGTEFAFVPRGKPESESPITWYTGDVYNYASSAGSAPGRETSNLARSLSLPPGEYIVLVRAIYEIRMFGDPGKNAPAIRLKFACEVDKQPLRLLDAMGIIPDVENGWCMGDWISVPIGLAAEELDMTLVSASGGIGGSLEVDIPGPIHIVGGQTRPVAIRVRQSKPLLSSTTHFDICFRTKDGGSRRLHWRVKLRHRTLNQPFMMSFASAMTTQGLPAAISYAVVVPPPTAPAENDIGPSYSPSMRSQAPPVLLGLHGAGVDIRDPAWASAMPNCADMWAVLPTGRTEWGEDWHGGSMTDAWAARDALPSVLGKLGMKVSSETL